MKALVLLFFLGLIAPNLLAQKTFKGNIARVHALGGIPLRKAASPQAERIMTLENGYEISIIGPALGSLTVEGVKGNWRKAKYGDKEGFVFDGFLSDLPMGDGCDADAWVSTVSSIEELEDKELDEQLHGTPLTLKGFKYNNDITVYCGSASCLNVSEWIFTNRSPEEAFIFVRNAMNLKNLRLDDAKTVKTKRNAQGDINEIRASGTSWDLFIHVKGKNTFMTYESRCGG